MLPAGYSSILRPLTAQIPKEAIITKCPVKKIHWKRKKTLTGLDTVDENEENDSDDSEKTVTEFPTPGNLGGVAKAAGTSAPGTREGTPSSNNNSRCGSVESDSGNNDFPIRVTCEDGRVFNAEHVICTIPLGVLKKCHKTLFDPELPHYKQESIEHLMFGTVDKIYLEYDRPFLSADISEIMLLWDDDKYEEHASDEERATHEFLTKHWFKKIYSFAKISDTLLLGWVSGLEAEFMETLSSEAVAEKCTEILRNFLQDPYVPKPRRCVW